MLARLISLSALSTVITISYCQDIVFPCNESTGKIVFSEVIRVDSISKNIIQNNLTQWLVKHHMGDRSLLMYDTAAGIISGVIQTPLKIESSFTALCMFSTIALHIKEGRFKYELSEIIYQKCRSEETTGVAWGYYGVWGVTSSTKIETCEEYYKEFLKSKSEKKSKGNAKKARNYIEETNKAVQSIISDLKQTTVSMKEDW